MNDPAARPPAPDPAAPARRPGLFAPVALGLSLLVLIGVALQRILRSREESSANAQSSTADGGGHLLADWGALPEFHLVDRRSAPFTQADLKGHVTVVNFFFTSCPGPCIDLTRRMRSVGQLFAGAKEVQLVSISVDPDADTPAQLDIFAKAQGAELPAWHWLTGEPAQVTIASAGFLAPTGQKNEAGQVIHSTKIYVVDRDGRLRGIHDTQTDPEWLKAVSNSVRLLLAGDARPPQHDAAGGAPAGEKR